MRFQFNGIVEGQKVLHRRPLRTRLRRFWARLLYYRVEHKCQSGFHKEFLTLLVLVTAPRPDLRDLLSERPAEGLYYNC